MKKTHEQLMNFVPSYRAGYVSGGARGDELKDDEEIVMKMEEADVQNEAQAEKLGREHGFEARYQK